MHKLIERIEIVVNRILSALQQGHSEAKLEAIHTDVRHIKEAIDFEPPDETAQQAEVDALVADLQTSNDAVAAALAAHRFSNSLTEKRRNTHD